MSSVFACLRVSRDGFVAGHDRGPEHSPDHASGGPWGDGEPRAGALGAAFAVEAGAAKPPRAGAHVVGRRMFEKGRAGRPSDPPPFRGPVFVLTSRAREPWVGEDGTTFTFVTDGIASALDQALTAAGGSDVQVSGGAQTVRQFLNAGLLDELEIHFAPMVLGTGERLFEGVDRGLRLVPVRVTGSPEVTHVSYRVGR
ncbi:dihydrofolate reductase family protein [Streptomyces sp. NPDC059176]|uniref:dihydrofolate reductase family protein n=1 Tax=unclassified Streptomyces TaxID=2593676 RepID=UPI0036BE64D5